MDPMHRVFRQPAGLAGGRAEEGVLPASRMPAASTPSDDPPAHGAAIVDRTFSRLAQSRELVQLYNRWFQRRLPTGERLDLPMSPQLEEIFRVQGVPE
jgi:hypothetical protein